MPPTLSRLVALVPLLLAAPAAAQLKPLRVSPAASASLEMGVTSIKVDYHAPAMKGRVIWGKLVPYGEVWRTGANEATTIAFSDPVKVAGKDVPAGRYAFFAIPAAKKWTLILSKQANLWGSSAYKESEDLLRFDVKPQVGSKREFLSYQVVPISERGVRIELEWAKVRVAFEVDVDVHGLYKKRVLEAIGKARPENQLDVAVYYQAAQYYHRRDQELPQALAWADIALKLQESYSNHELRARILERLGKREEAIAALEKALQLVKPRMGQVGAPPKDYIDGLERDLVAWKAKRS